MLPVSSIRIALASVSLGGIRFSSPRAGRAAGARTTQRRSRSRDWRFVILDRSSVDLRRLVLNVNYRDLRDIQLAAGVSYDARGQRAQLVNLNITGPIGRIRADGVLALDPQGGESYLNGDTSALDALALMQALELPYFAATRIDGQARARWPALEFARATGDAKVVTGGEPSAAFAWRYPG